MPIAVSNKTKIAKAISEFKTFIEATKKNMLEAARKYAVTVASFGEQAEKAFRESYPDVADRTWDMLRRVGNGDLTVAALTCPSYLTVSMVSSLPLKTQVILLGDESHLPVKQNILSHGKEVSKFAKDMSAAEVYTLIDIKNKKIRSIAEQKHGHKIPSVMVKTQALLSPYAVEGESLVISRSCVIGKNEMLKIVKAMGI